METQNSQSAVGQWLAPTVYLDSPAEATVSIPGSKSLTNRYLLLAALANSPSLLHGPLHSRDSALMVAALESLGARFEEVQTGSVFGPDVRVFPIDFSAPEISQTIDVGLAGTVMRFVPPVAALRAGSTTFDGDHQARERPMGPIIDSLRGLGIEVEDDARGALPFTVISSGSVLSDQLSIDASESSQFVSALLLSACRFESGLTLRHRGGAIPSMPHVDMTVEVLRSVGVQVDQPEPAVWHIAPASFAGFEVTVEPDLSNAGPFLAAAVALGATVSVADWPSVTTQGGNYWLDILPRFGARVERSEGFLRVTGPTGGARAGFRGVDLDLSEAGELAPTVAALCALATSPSQLRGIAHLRGHETDRLAALTAEINRLGGRAHETEDGLRIESGARHGGFFETYSDHRMATAAAIIGLVVPQVIVEDIGTTSKTLPNFTGLWQSMLDRLVESSHRGV